MRYMPHESYLRIGTCDEQTERHVCLIYNLITLGKKIDVYEHFVIW